MKLDSPILGPNRHVKETVAYTGVKFKAVMQPEDVNLPYVQFNATNRIGSLSRWKYHRSPI